MTMTRRRPAAPPLAIALNAFSSLGAFSFLTSSGALGRCRLRSTPFTTARLFVRPSTAAMPSPMKKVCKYDETDEKDVLSFAKLTEHAYAPFKGSEYAAGFDLKSAYPYVVKAHDKELVKTDLQIKVPHATYGRIAPRSGLAWKNFIDVGAGVIDEDYRGNVGVLLFNHSDTDFQVNPGDRVAQLICEKISYPELKELETLDETARGEGGFGSTGTN